MLILLRSLYHVQKQHMIQFTVRQSYEHVTSLALIISCAKTAHNPIHRSSIIRACYLSCAHYIMNKLMKQIQGEPNKIKNVDLHENNDVLELLHKNNSIGGPVLCYINE